MGLIDWPARGGPVLEMSLKFVWNRDRKLLQGVVGTDPNRCDTLAFQIERHADSQPDHPCLRYGQKQWSYAEFNRLINKHAHAYANLGVTQGDVVALIMENRPEFFLHLFGLHKLGAVASLLNTQVRGEVLTHALSVSHPRFIVVGSELWAAWIEVADHFSSEEGHSVPAWIDMDADHGEQVPADATPFDELVRDASDLNPEQSGRQTLSQLAAYIYTSGTTGKPKAARITHLRMYRAAAAWSALALRYRQHDVMYNCLPLYHSNGLMLACGSAFSAGITVALARRFSVSHFWEDVRRHGATSFIYIGELCRYLLSAPESPKDKEHHLRVISGNGMRAELWREFKNRFGIERIAEFYAATEGNCITFNVFGLEGSVGPILPSMTLVRWDDDKEEIVRDARGLAVRAKRGEPGLLLGKIANDGLFEGYEDQRATNAKIIQDVRKPGDRYFNTGDLLRVRKGFFLYFVDRLGDTFRWRGENVATLEVQETLLRQPSLAQALVYGVHIPGAEGRAGMAALLLEGAAFDPEEFAAFVDGALPNFARPLFVRLVSEMEMTGTLKLRPTELKAQGFNPDACNGDSVWVREPKQPRYVPLTPERYAEIAEGKHHF